jgi:hypothetical protein
VRGVALLAAVGLAGCGAPSVEHRPVSKIALAQTSHEYPSAPARRQQVGHASRSPSVAVANFADGYINWTAHTLAADMMRLAARSIGQARAATRLAAAQAAGDYELQRDGIANSGTVEAIAALPGRPHQYVVVTRERTTATGTTAYEGLQPAWHVAIATVSRVGPGRWALSGWQPQS